MSVSNTSEKIPNLSLSFATVKFSEHGQAQVDTYKHTHEDGTVTIHHNGDDPARGTKHGDLVD